MEEKRIKQLSILSGFVFATIFFMFIAYIILFSGISNPNGSNSTYVFFIINIFLASCCMLVNNIGMLTVSSIIIHKQKTKEEKYYPIMQPIAIMFLVASVASIMAIPLSVSPAIGSSAAAQMLVVFGILTIVAFSILIHNLKKWKRDGFIPQEPEVYTAPFAPFDSGLEPEVDQNLVIKAKKTKSKSVSKSKSK